MAWIYRPNIFAGSGDGRQIVWNLKEMLKDAGWTVIESATGSAYSAGDILDAPGDFGTRSWFRVQMPEHRGQKREFVFQKGSSDRSWRVKYSKAAGFTDGSAGSNETPSAIDEMMALGGGTDNSPTTDNIFMSQGLWSQMGAQNSAPYGFWAGTYRADNRNMAGGFLFDPLRTGSFPDADDDPYVCYFPNGSNSNIVLSFAAPAAAAAAEGGISNVSGLSGVRAWMGASPASIAGASFAQYASGVRDSFQGYGTNPYSGEDVFLPVIYMRSQALAAPNGVKGISSVLQINSALRQPGDTTTDLSKIQLGNCVLDWDGATIPEV